jgi:hypothetical protein
MIQSATSPCSFWENTHMIRRETRMTETKRTMVSKSAKKRVRLWPVLPNASAYCTLALALITHIQPTMTSSGTTNEAIWMDEPTQIPMVSSIWIFQSACGQQRGCHKPYLVLHGHPDGGDVLCRVTAVADHQHRERRQPRRCLHNRQQDETDERLRDVVHACGLLDRRDQHVCAERGDDRRREQ